MALERDGINAFLLEAQYPNGDREAVNYSTTRIDNTLAPELHLRPRPRAGAAEGHGHADHHVARQHPGQPEHPDPRQWVSYGPRTVDEMAHANQQVIFITDEDYERITEEREARAALTDDE